MRNQYHSFSDRYTTEAFVATIISTRTSGAIFFVETEHGKVGTHMRHYEACKQASDLEGKKAVIRTRVRNSDGKVFFHSAEPV